MNGSGATEMGDEFPEFTLSEIVKMEKLFKQEGVDRSSRDFCQEVAARFSGSRYRRGQSCIKWEQVQSWFQDKQGRLTAEPTTSLIVPGEFHPSLELAIVSTTPETPLKSKAERIASLSELMFEGRSSRDGAWYDVAAFLSYRVLCSGELEVRVRFAGFSNLHDEWVNVKRGLRERSIPLEASECDRVNVGDLVLCFRETDDHAIYCDAHIVGIQRQLHDFTSCKCIFLVRYVCDRAEETVDLTRICRRPA
ncbi:protein SAWADEE HOMEODOMAIN HOMOLOG 1 [Diospyros lotus]|uniref:protein SAWADEE HOMEODOMAIN HOMOLOG 1 n=1 Tax=Diospyros lotus TaxID=55363 RepID=UPI002251AD48|nr:protein SAWADEE HOMEODOMAIN HOMOLOG 1 [Diospyros lotus]